MKSYSLAAIEELSDDEVYKLSHAQVDIDLQATEQERECMITAHTKMVEDFDEDIRESVNWNPEVRSNWDLYSELRINGYPIQQAPTPSAGLHA